MQNNDHVYEAIARGAQSFPTSTSVPGNWISKREYYAAHAPAIPNWFMPEDESDGIPSTHSLNEANKRQLAMVLGNMLSLNDASPEVRSFMAKFYEAKDGRAAAKRKALEHRFFAWRKYYADMMIQAGSEKP